ncbi:hypothetical protein N431DRAFT_466160 [Stipitochalara longipes BDJ]|nr:hypothetical protein N431DRAFT_466160 [Stipitochalara longipes BDJ]
MSGRSTPKRPLEVDGDEDFQRENYRLKVKSYPHVIYSRSIFASRSCSRSSDGKASSLETLSDEVQTMLVGFDKGVVEAPQRSCLPPLSSLQSTSACQFPQVSSTFLATGSGSHKSYARKEEEIFFGMLKGVEIKIIANQNKDPKSFENIGRDEDIFTYLDLIFGQDRCDVQFQGINIATMQTKTQHALQQLISCSNGRVRYKALVPRADLKEKLDAVVQPLSIDKSKLSWSMNMQVFGVRSIADTVAKELSKYRLFLQHPNPVPFNAAYENPQFLSIVQPSFSNGAILPPISVGVTQKEIESNVISEEFDHIIDELRAIMNNLPGHNYLKEADIDARINTDLLRQVYRFKNDFGARLIILWSHQKIAVDFVMGRESTEEQSPRALWHVDHRTLGAPVSRSQAADDILGGILADDMGLGKTLTMIATIATTLSRAIQFATGEFSPDKGTKSGKIPVMSTLVIVPSVLLLKGWIDEIVKHVVPGTLNTYVYHGSDRNLASSSPSPLPYHIVFSTYGTVAADFIGGGGVLNWFHWYRLILDEAHTIRNWTTKSFKAVTSLSANIRWCMTGTPIQNSLNDLRSLVQFLRVPHLEDTAVFRKHIAEIRGIGKGIPRPKPDYENLKLLLGSICLRRSISSLSLGVTFLFERPHLSEVEKRAYNNLAMSCKRAVDAAVSERQAAHGNRSILTALLRLRIFCNTGLSSFGAMGKNAIEPFNPDEICSLLQQSGEVPVCVECGCDILSFDANDSLYQQPSNPHRRFKCHECIQLVTASYDGGSSSRGHHSPAHSVDRLPILLPTKDSRCESGSKSYRTISDLSTYPSKLKAVLSDIMEHQSEAKSIVFSMWKRSLDFMARLLYENSIVFGQVDGTLSPDRRQKVLTEFHHDPSVKVLLMTLGTGAQGINNLSVASRVHILEPQWNPSVEDQAIGRVLRLGQDKKSVRNRQMVKIQLALAGGLQSSDTKKSSENQRTIGLEELSNIIESIVFTEVPTAVPQVAENRL